MSDPRVDWRSVSAGFVLLGVIFVLLVAVSHPLATGATVVTGVTLYGLVRAIRRAEFARSVQICRARFCLRLQLRIG